MNLRETWYMFWSMHRNRSANRVGSSNYRVPRIIQDAINRADGKSDKLRCKRAGSILVTQKRKKIDKARGGSFDPSLQSLNCRCVTRPLQISPFRAIELGSSSAFGFISGLQIQSIDITGDSPIEGMDGITVAFDPTASNTGPELSANELELELRRAESEYYARLVRAQEGISKRYIGIPVAVPFSKAIDNVASVRELFMSPNELMMKDLDDGK